MFNVNHGRTVVIGDERARLAALGPFGVEHEVVNDELASAVEEVRQRFLALGPVEDVLLFNPFPGQISARLAQLVPQSRELLLLDKQLLASRQPLLLRDCLVNHDSYLPSYGST